MFSEKIKRLYKNQILVSMRYCFKTKHYVPEGDKYSSLGGIENKHKKFTFSDDFKCGDVVAMYPRDNVVLDVDVKNGKKGLESLARLESDLGIKFKPTVWSYSECERGRGCHIYLRRPKKYLETPFVTKLDAYPDLEIKTKTNLVNIAGSNRLGKNYELVDKNITDLFENEIPEELISLLLKTKKTGGTIAKPKKFILECLRLLNPSCDRDMWLRVGMAIHSWNEDAMDVWDNWSKDGNNYNYDDLVNAWCSFSGSGVTYRTLIDMYKKAGGKQEDLNKLDALEGLKVTEVETSNWVRVLSIQKLQYYKDGRFYDLQALKTYLLENKVINKKSDFNDFKDFIFNVDYYAYYPQVTSRIFKHNGDLILNTFREDLMPKGTPIGEGKKYIDMFISHLSMLIGDDKSVNILLDFIAHVVQRKGKLRWCPVIQGVQGCGKSLIGDLMSDMLGGLANVNTITQKCLKSEYTYWATDALLGIVQELKINDKNKHIIANDLKAYITDNTITILKKYEKPVEVYNVMNYICFTNYKDCIPIDRNDRRYWIVFTRFQTKEEFNKHLEFLGTTRKEYFSTLVNGFKKYLNEFVEYFSQMTISDEFYEYEEAPETEARQALIESNKNAITGLVECEELLDSGSEFYNKQIIITQVLFQDLGQRYQLYLTPNEKKYIMDYLGFLPLKKSFKYKGSKYHTVYVKDLNIDNVGIRKILAR